MRRQYHSRQVGGHELIWDVHRLVALSRALPVEQVPLSAIVELDEPFWYPGGATATCRSVAEHAQFIQETDLAYPIILSSDGRVMDGMHRVCRALIEGKRTIAAVRFTQDPPPDHVDVDVDSLPYDEPA